MQTSDPGSVSAIRFRIDERTFDRITRDRWGTLREPDVMLEDSGRWRAWFRIRMVDHRIRWRLEHTAVDRIIAAAIDPLGNVLCECWKEDVEYWAETFSG